MTIYAVFGVRASNLDEANAIVQKVMPTEGLDCDNGNYGRYFRYGHFLSEKLKVLKNEDIYDGEPVVAEANSWKFVALLEGAEPDSKFLAALNSRPDEIVKIYVKTY
jgi:hypothetical protein